MKHILLGLVAVLLLLQPTGAMISLVQGSSDTPYEAYSIENINGTVYIYMSQSMIDWLPDPAPKGYVYAAVPWLGP